MTTRLVELFVPYPHTLSSESPAYASIFSSAGVVLEEGEELGEDDGEEDADVTGVASTDTSSQYTTGFENADIVPSLKLVPLAITVYGLPLFVQEMVAVLGREPPYDHIRASRCFDEFIESSMLYLLAVEINDAVARVLSGLSVVESWINSPPSFPQRIPYPLRGYVVFENSITYTKCATVSPAEKSTVHVASTCDISPCV